MKPFDISKFKKTITKTLPGISSGFHDPKTWISTGSYLLNKLISNDFNKGIPLGKSTVFAGESGCLPATAIVTIKNPSGQLVDITVAELKTLWTENNKNNTPTIIITPDGDQQIGAWFNKGILPMVRVMATDTFGKQYSTYCANNHMIQMEDNTWTLAEDLKIFDVVQTVTGNAQINAVNEGGPTECFDFEILHSNHRYYGDGFVSHNSGKSLICSGTIIKNAQDQGIFVILIDTENALDESWLHNFGVDTSEEKMLKLSMAMVDDVARTISDFMKGYKDQYGSLPESERPKILFVIDSLGMLMTPTDVAQFESGEMKGDMGRKPKALKALLTNVTNMFGQYDVGLLCTNHTYASQDMYNPDPKVSGGSGPIFAASIVVVLQKRKLKEDEFGAKITDVAGIRSAVMVEKSRYAKPFEKCELKIPYETGMSPYTGMFEFLEGRGILEKLGNRYQYVDNDGVVHLHFRKNIPTSLYDIIIREWDTRQKEDPIITDDTDIIEVTTELE
jgi:RecA/RadA recombinase